MAPQQGRANPVRAARKAFSLRASLVLGLLVAVGLAGAWRFWPSPGQANSSIPPRRAQQTESELGKALAAAIRDGDLGQVRSLLQQGADANGRDEAGDTALLQAALRADTEMMRLLLASGAAVNARGPDGTTALLRAVHDPDKVRLLLGWGARVDDVAMVVAARVPGCRRTLELLLAHGGNGRAAVQGYTALMAAAGNGDLEAVRCLLGHGADSKARTPTGYTALHGAAVAGNAAVVGLLLDRGADANVSCELADSGGDVQTPAMAAALLGHAECLERLLARGANVNVQGGPFERTALLGAATTGSMETVRLLLARGAHVNAEDWEGATPLDWALRRGGTSIVHLLRTAGARESSPPRPGDPGPPLPQKRDEDPVRRAVAASLPPLQRSGRRITEKNGCVTCHQHALLAMTVGLARKRGLAVDEAIASQERAHVLAHLGARLRILLLGAGIDSTLTAYSLVGLAAENQEPNRVTDALVHYLLLRQRQDGRWQTENYRPPEDASDFLFTALAVRGLQAYAPKGRRREVGERIARARDWLGRAQAAETTDRVFQLLGLGWANAEAAAIQRASRLLLGEQRPDGGWAQLPTLPSDAYATGTVLYALHQGGGISSADPAYRRGVAFLLRSQRADGSWFVPTRSFPMVAYSTSGFPHGRSQFISAAATCWATMALTLTLPLAEYGGETGREQVE